MGDLATMAASTTHTKRRTVHCSKHAFAPIASFRPQNAVAPRVTLPAQRHQNCHGRAGLASESSFVGDDPVNGTDPTGLFSIGQVAQAAGEAGLTGLAGGAAGGCVVGLIAGPPGCGLGAAIGGIGGAVGGAVSGAVESIGKQLGLF
jgi:hypothetical protein